jgi:hypothetical protein
VNVIEQRGGKENDEPNSTTTTVRKREKKFRLILGKTTQLLLSFLSRSANLLYPTLIMENLKWIISLSLCHRRTTCVIPAKTQKSPLKENKNARRRFEMETSNKYIFLARIFFKNEKKKKFFYQV